MKILSAKFVTSAAWPKQFPTDSRPQVAFAGRSNVGKSSLINALLNRKSLVKTSSTPGKTQLINFFLINDDFYCVDLPGYGYAKAPRSVVDAWAPMIEGYIRDSPQIRAVVVLLDIRRDPDARDVRLLEWLRHYGVPAFYVLTKADKLKRGEAAKARQSIAKALGLAEPPLLTSVMSGQGIGELKTEVARRLRDGSTAAGRRQPAKIP
jgi:GTP-binding protein